MGDINPGAAGNAFWAPTQTNQGGVLSLAGMASMYNTISVGNDQPTIIFARQQGYEAYEALLTGQIRYSDTDMADGGFQNLLFKGAPITFDDSCEANAMYFLNTKYIQLGCSQRRLVQANAVRAAHQPGRCVLTAPVLRPADYQQPCPSGTPPRHH